MKEYIVQRVLEGANYIIEHEATIREVAHELGVSKSTVHLDITNRLGRISSKKKEDVEKILERNKELRAIRGGMATKLKYQNN